MQSFNGIRAALAKVVAACGEGVANEVELALAYERPVEVAINGGADYPDTLLCQPSLVALRWAAGQVFYHPVEFYPDWACKTRASWDDEWMADGADGVPVVLLSEADSRNENKQECLA